MEELATIYREVVPDQTNPQLWKDITLNTGATQSTLQDIKVAEKAGGFCYKDITKVHNRNRFIYWRTSHDVLELSEISLDLNLNDNHIRYKFADSPVLTVAIYENKENIIILVATVSSIHRLNYMHPDKIQKQHTSEILSNSIFHDATANAARDPSTFYVIGHTASSNNPIPHTATCWLQTSVQEALFCLAYQNVLMLFTMNCNSGQTVATELKQHYIVPRIFSNITGALRGKSNTTDNLFVTSVVFNSIGGHIFLYALYRDDNIRMWSTKTGQCVSVVNCLQDGKNARSQGPQTNALRRASSNTICVFLCYSTGSEFITIQTMSDGNGSGYSMARTNLIQAPKYDLVDFEINDNRIWGLWCNSDGEFNIESYLLNPSGLDLNWTLAVLEQSRDGTIVHGVDPRQTYCSYIFRPGKFQRNVIAKALVMFRRSNVLYDPNLSMSTLKDRVCQAIETEIQNEIKDFEVTDEEYIEISSKFWERFYSCCEQYHVKASQPIGLIIMDSMDGVCIVKKNTFSLLRPCEPLEQLMLTGEKFEFTSANANESGRKFYDLIQLVSILSILEHHILVEIKTDIDMKLYELNIPNAVISKLVTDMLSGDMDENIFCHKFLNEINQKIRAICDLPSAMILLLDTLRLDHGEPEAMQTHINLSYTTRLLLSIGHLFCSDIGVSLVAESLKQIASIRFSLCRSLLILQYLLIDTFDLQSNQLEVIRSRCMPETVVFIQAYYVMLWLCETSAQIGSSTSIESSIQSLSMLQLTDSLHNVYKTNQHISLLELFLRGKGSITGLSLLVERPYRNLSETQWQYTLLPLTTIIGQLVWAVSGNFVFGEWLISSCQPVLIQEYVRLLSSWCEWNNCSRHFIAAVSFLDNGEPHKAYDLFMKASKGILIEPFLEKIILSSSNVENMNQHEAITQYYLKVIQLFEQHSALDYVIALAKAAIDILNKDDPQLAMFQSIVFTNHLNLEHYSEAYHALIGNAESSRRKDCLRQLIVCLFQKKRLDILMQFPYVRLQEELENIVESRGRSMAIEDNIHYDFLYAFHITKGNMRKASSIMYEKAMRYALECESATALQCRYECLLSCVNTLYLVDEKYAWIAKPIINDDIMDTNDEVILNQQITVLEINDIKRELILTEAILCLAKHRQELGSILNTDADELIAVLSNAGLYTASIKLAIGFNKPITSILESLASACVRATNENSNDVWAWLQENDLADLPHKNQAVNMAWKLLEKLISDHEMDNHNSTLLRKSVTNKILSLGEFLPHWLYLSYKKSNPSEMLQLYVNNGRLIEATDLAKEYIWAMIKSGGEYFGLKNSIQFMLPALCFPVNTIDLLIYGLELNSQYDEEYSECLKDLTELVQYYVDIAKDVSNTKVQYDLRKELTNK